MSVVVMILAGGKGSELWLLGEESEVDEELKSGRCWESDVCVGLVGYSSTPGPGAPGPPPAPPGPPGAPPGAPGMPWALGRDANMLIPGFTWAEGSAPVRAPQADLLCNRRPSRIYDRNANLKK